MDENDLNQKKLNIEKWFALFRNFKTTSTTQRFIDILINNCEVNINQTAVSFHDVQLVIGQLYDIIDEVTF